MPTTDDPPVTTDIHKPKLVIFNDDQCIIEFPGRAWFANYTSIDSPVKLLKCIFYLSQKDWITSAHIYDLVGQWEIRFGDPDVDLSLYDAMS